MIIMFYSDCALSVWRWCGWIRTDVYFTAFELNAQSLTVWLLFSFTMLSLCSSSAPLSSSVLILLFFFVVRLSMCYGCVWIPPTVIWNGNRGMWLCGWHSDMNSKYRIECRNTSIGIALIRNDFLRFDSNRWMLFVIINSYFDLWSFVIFHVEDVMWAYLVVQVTMKPHSKYVGKADDGELIRYIPFATA